MAQGASSPKDPRFGKPAGKHYRRTVPGVISRELRISPAGFCFALGLFALMSAGLSSKGAASVGAGGGKVGLAFIVREGASRG